VKERRGRDDDTITRSESAEPGVENIWEAEIVSGKAPTSQGRGRAYVTSQKMDAKRGNFKNDGRSSTRTWGCKEGVD